MLLNPDRFADRGCWISGDRVYAFLSSMAHGVTEVGFHGPQPVSTNSRVLVEADGALQCFRRDHGGNEVPLRFTSLEWFAGGAAVSRGDSAEETVIFEASGNCLAVRFTNMEGEAILRLRKSALFTNVHGVRQWDVGLPRDGWIHLGFRDTISLDRWMKRGGPYGGDFLIPEPVRRRIFRTEKRSGEATSEDLRAEFRNRPFPIYDARVRLRIGGPGFLLEEDDHSWIFTSRREWNSDLIFTLLFFPGTDPTVPEQPVAQEDTPEVRNEYERLFASAPALRVPGHPHVERFFTTLPALTESSIIRDFGVPRATPGRYYWIWAWDAMVTAFTGLRWGALRTAEGTAEFVDAHRDVGGAIPMRWTHDLQPLDTQPPGALESLLLTLVDAITGESGDERLLRRIYPRVTEHLRRIEEVSDRRGFFPNIGFYPDLPLRFGRSHQSAVALEAGAFYLFCRTCETAALRFGDRPVALRAGALAARFEGEFLKAFWDRERGFLRDSIDLQTGAPNPSTPLFSLLLLQLPAGITPLRPRLNECAEFLSQQLLTTVGFRTLPPSDPHAQSETVSAAWYPHWDQYAVKIFRRCGRSAEILRWLGAVERALEALGSCPEHLPIESLLAGDPGAWREHGSTSNLNCATGWYSALLEGIFGWEVDRGGVTIIPLSLPLGPIALQGVVSRGTTFDVAVENRGRTLESILLDGEELWGTAKFPVRTYDRKRHRVEIRYGECPEKARLLELINGEITESGSTEGGALHCELLIRTFGRGEAVIATPAGEVVLLDGSRVPPGPSATRMVVPIAEAGEHRLIISRA